MTRHRHALLVALHLLSSRCNSAVAYSNANPLRDFASAANANHYRRGKLGHKVLALHATTRQHSSSATYGTEGESPSSDNDTSIPKNTNNNNHLSRRRWISTTTSSIAFLASQPQTALAAPPLTSDAADNFSARIERSLRPKPAKVLRPRMNLDFAVLLMRSSYNAVDEIDIVPMDQFQRDFFLIRQAEYKPYSESLGNGAMIQGDLADPNYFDFISFAQYATINREMVNPPSVFEEQQPVEVGEDKPQRFDAVVVKRDPSLAVGDLPRRHAELVGDAILDKLIEKFGETASAIPMMEAGSRPGAKVVLASIRQMVNLFVVSGFAFGGSVEIVKNGASGGGGDGAAGTQFSIVFTSPVTLWSGQSLKAKNNAVLMNDFGLKAVRSMMSRAGYSVTNDSVKYASNQEITTFTII